MSEGGISTSNVASTPIDAIALAVMTLSSSLNVSIGSMVSARRKTQDGRDTAEGLQQHLPFLGVDRDELHLGAHALCQLEQFVDQVDVRCYIGGLTALGADHVVGDAHHRY